MVTRYPHYLNVTTISAATERNADGDWIGGGEETTLKLDCRAVENIYQSDQGNSGDGKRIDFSWTVYLPKDVPFLRVGTRVTLVSKLDGTSFSTETIKRFVRGQLNTRVWL